MAAAVGLGAGGIDRRTRLRVIAMFGLLETAMPIIGLLLGHGLASDLGRQTRWLAGGLLAAVGTYSIVQAVRASKVPERSAGRAGNDRQEAISLLLTALALSLDNLVVGFALGAYHVSLAVGAVVFGVVSVVMSLAGLEFG